MGHMPSCNLEATQNLDTVWQLTSMCNVQQIGLDNLTCSNKCSIPTFRVATQYGMIIYVGHVESNVSCNVGMHKTTIEPKTPTMC